VVPATALLVALPLFLWSSFGDQVLFALGADQMRHGGRYLRDIWDIKQPGIFWFYYLGSFFGGALGARILEVGLVFGVGLAFGRRLVMMGSGHLIAALALLLTLAPYTTLASRGGVGQVEGLLNPLLLASLLLIFEERFPSPSVRRWFAAGVVGGLIVVLKLLLILLLPFLTLPPLLALWRRDRSKVLRVSISYLTGICAVVVPSVFLLLRAVPFTELRYTFFTLPPQIAANPVLHASGTVVMLRDLLMVAMPSAPLILLGLWGLGRGKVPIELRRSAVGVSALGMALVGAILGATQLNTSYRHLLLSVPLGILTIPGIAVTISALRTRSRKPLAIVLVCLMACAPMGIGFAKLAATPGRWSLYPEQGPRISALREELAADPISATVVGEMKPADTLYVVGNPELYWALEKPQALAINGWSPEMYPAKVYRELHREMDCARPTWVFVDSLYAPYVAEGSPDLMKLLSTSYTSRASERGSWYRSKSSTSPHPVTSCDAAHGDWGS